MAFNISGARKAGYSDREIAEYLIGQGDSGVDISGARKAGYSDKEILDHMLGGPAKADTAPAPIDDRTGASLWARAIIGSAADDEGKLARTRAIYGDSARLDKDKDGEMRVSFVDPDTGRRTFVNPTGFDFGDVLGGTREIGSALASIPAGIGGFFGGGPVGSAAAASAAGAAAGQGLDALAALAARKIAEKQGHTVPEMQSPIDAAKEFGTEAAIGTAGGAILGKAVPVVTKALNPMKQEVVQAFKDIGMDIPTVGSASGKAGAMYEAMLGNNPFSLGLMEDARIKAGNDLYDSVLGVAKDIGGENVGALSTPTELGDFAKKAAGKFKNEFAQKSKEYYDDVLEKYGDSSASLANISREIDAITAHLSPEARAAAQNELWALLKNEVKDADAGMLNYATLKNARTRLGEALKQSGTAGNLNVSDANVSRLRNALGLDMDASLTLADPEAAEAARAWDKAYAAHSKAAKKADDAIFGSGKNEKDAQAVGKALSSQNLSPETVEALREVLSPEDFNTLSGGIFRQMALPVASSGEGEGFTSAAHLSTKLGYGRGSAMPKETRAALGWEDAKKMEALKIVSDSLAQNARNANTSKTAQQLISWGMLKDLVSIPYDVARGIAKGDTTALKTAIPALSSVFGAKLTTSPKVISYLARPQGEFSKAATKYSGLLGAMAAEPFAEE